MGDIVFNIKSVIDAAVGVGIDIHAADGTNPHAVTKAQVGLSEVDNTSDADKPVSIAQQALMDTKANIAGQVFTGDVAVPNLAVSGTVDGRDVSADGSALDTAITDAATHNADTSNPHAVTKLQVGLGNADDTSDATKNVATAELTNKTLTSYTNKIHADQLHVRVKCVDADGILTGQAVMFSGYNSGEDAIEVILADNTVGVAIGLAEEDMSNGVFGTITMNGIIEGLDTSTYDEGQILYIGTAGALTATEPTTGFSQPLAFVLRPHSVNGALQVNASYPKQDASDVRNTPAGGIVATTVQDAIAELDTEKFDKTGGAISGDITTTGLFDGRDVATDGTKLDGIEDDATADQTDSEIKTAYENNADTNAYTDDEQTKLGAIEDSATADQTGAEIKTAYEGEADTNAFTDANVTKLDGIEDSATADQTDAEILTAVKNVDGVDSGLDADLLDGQEGTFYQDASNLNAGIIPDERLPDSITSDITGNAATATVWQTPRTISTSGDATGSVSGVDGSGDADIVLTVKDDVALGGSPTTTTQAVADESTKIATTQYVVDKINETEEVA